MSDEKHLYLVISGGYVAGATAMAEEIWQTGVRLLMAPGGAPDPIGTISNAWDVVADSINRTETNWTISSNWTTEAGVNDLDPGDYLNDQAGPAVKAFIQTAGLFSTAVQLRSLKLYPISAPTGVVVPAPPYAQGSPALLTYTGTQPIGNSSGAMLPPNNSCVASLRTPQIGRKGRGRMFTPPMGVAALGTSGELGTVQSTQRTLLAGAMKTLLEALALDGTALGNWVYPIVTGSPYTGYSIVNTVRVGSIMDGQNRRRRSLTETYTSASMAY